MVHDKCECDIAAITTIATKANTPLLTCSSDWKAVPLAAAAAPHTCSERERIEL